MIVFGIFFCKVLAFVGISFLVPFTLSLQQFGTRTCHLAWYLLHFGMVTFHFERYLLHFAMFAKVFAAFWHFNLSFAWYVPHFVALSVHVCFFRASLGIHVEFL